MEGLINLIILYVIFSTISSFVKRLKQQQSQQQAALKKSGQISKPQSKKVTPPLFEETLAAPPRKEPPPLLEDALELDDDEIEFHEGELPPEPPAERLPLPERLAQIPSVQRVKTGGSTLLPEFGENSYLQGIILAEILGPPVSRRRSRRGG